jgi:hypothetical protein
MVMRFLLSIQTMALFSKLSLKLTKVIIFVILRGITNPVRFKGHPHDR